MLSIFQKNVEFQTIQNENKLGLSCAKLRAAQARNPLTAAQFWQVLASIRNLQQVLACFPLTHHLIKTYSHSPLTNYSFKLTIYSLLDCNLLTNYSPFTNHFLTTYSQLTCNLLNTYSQLTHYLLTTYSKSPLPHHLLNTQTQHLDSTFSPFTHKLLKTYPPLAHHLLTTYSPFIHRLLTSY